MNAFVEQHRDEISGVLSCFDRVVITGTLPDICHAGAMAGYLGGRGIRLFDYARWAEPLREAIPANAERLAAEAGLEIEFIRKLKGTNRGQCGLARPRVLAGGSPAWVIVSREPSIEPCGAVGHSGVDAWARQAGEAQG